MEDGIRPIEAPDVVRKIADEIGLNDQLRPYAKGDKG